VPVLAGSAGPVSLTQAQAFLEQLPTGAGMLLKAEAGGGGRGVRAVESAAELEQAYARCQAEAKKAF